MANALAHARSPYLRAHADNPVAWEPWGDAALARARREDRPLFVSVGYSACHWCHVMAREAFSDTEVARLLNEHFVSIKIDREERPDLDTQFQVAHQVLNGRGGGWPLSMFLEPEGRTPFFAGTYFPLAPRYGMPGFADVLHRIIEAYREHRVELREQGGRLSRMLTERLGSDAEAAGELSLAPADQAAARLARSVDPVHGGFGDAPKFPQAPQLAFLLARGARDALGPTFEAMLHGGLFDHVGGGFFRYTVDAAWRVPHFEKMLYDNALLLGLYAEAAVRFDSDAFGHAARATARFMDAELALPGGGYAASLNAESDGEEGAFYVWTRDEVRAHVGDARYPAFAAAFGLDQAAQVEGRWHLARIDHGHGGFREELAALARERDKRRRPERDDKLLTSWNALAVTGLARAALFLRDDALATRATETLATLERIVAQGDEVLACALGGEAYQPGFLEDYAFLAEAALAVAAVTDGAAAIVLARKLADALLKRFRTDGGGLAMTPAGAESILYRPRRYADDAVPSGAGVAVRVLTILGHLLAEPEYLDAAEGVLRAAFTDLERAPEAFPTMLIALDEFLDPPPFVVLRGDKRIDEWARRAAGTHPGARIVRIGPDAIEPVLDRYGARGPAVAYVCRGTACSAPISDVQGLLAALS
jgi:uncharacterized protein